MAVRKKLQKIGGSRGIIIDRELLEVLLPDGDLEQTLLVEVAGDAIVVRREAAQPLTPEAIAAATETMTRQPDSVLELNLTDQRLLNELLGGPRNVTELSRAVERRRETTSIRLNTLLDGGWVERTGRDWRVTDAGRERLGADPAAPYAELPKGVARVVLALDAGPATAAELREKLGMSKSGLTALLARAVEAGLVVRTEEPVPVYSRA